MEKLVLLTGGDDVEYTGNPLGAHSVAGIAQKCSVVQLIHRCVAQDTGGTLSGNVVGSYVHTISAVVECPAEVDVRRIRIHHAPDFSIFLLCYSVDTGLVRATCRSNYCIKHKNIFQIITPSHLKLRIVQMINFL